MARIGSAPLIAALLAMSCLSARAQSSTVSILSAPISGIQTRLPTGLLHIGNDDYPIESLIANEEGRTILTIAVATDGHVTDARVDASSGHPWLDQAALRYAKLMSFWPGSADNPSNMDSLQIGVTWRLPLRALNDLNAENARVETVTASDAGGEMPKPMTSRVMTFGDYPPESVRDNEHGTVDLRYLIQNDGNVGAAEVISSSGIPRLDDAAVRMVQQRWKFRPATKDGKPIAMWRNARVAFQLTQAIPTPRECRDQPSQKTARVPAPSFWDGSLVVRRQVLSDETGQILDALLLTGKGWKRLERDILQLGHPAHFEPAPTKNGKPSRCWFDADITLSRNELMKLSVTQR